MAYAGVDPSIMGWACTRRESVEKADLDIADIECVELNEAFAAQSLPV